MSSDISERLISQVKESSERNTLLVIRGGDTKSFYGRLPEGQSLDVLSHSGVINYQPTELVVTARAGTTLTELEQLLDEHGQMLPFEPPHFGDKATIGGTVACGLSGPARPYRGAVRDYVLGVTLLDSAGNVKRFGGEVMKNVAGYDVSRLVTGSLGTLGVLLDISLKVLPKPRQEVTLVQQLEGSTAVQSFNTWAGKPLPISAICLVDERAYIRLSGTESGLKTARNYLGGEELKNGSAFWSGIREHSHGFFNKGEVLWRLSLPPQKPCPVLAGKQLIDWGGAQRWLFADDEPELLRRKVESIGGHAIQFRGGDRSGLVFHPLSRSMFQLHKNLKKSFDPKGIFNRGRMYPDW